ncbi:MAG: hypothetical protein RL616_262, partial [Verrucomicrobiota bacterium]
MATDGNQPSARAQTTTVAWRSRLFVYGFAIAVTLLVLLVRLSFSPWVGDRPLLIIFFIPILFSAYLGGLGPGLVATAIAAFAADYYLLPPDHGLSFDKPMDFIQWLILVASGVLASVLNEALHRARKRADTSKAMQAVTLASIGDAVITTDAAGAVNFLNAEAERLTGWTNAEAIGRSLPEVFHIVNEQTREIVEDPVKKVFRTGAVVGLANHTVLISRDGREFIIDDSGAPIRNPQGKIIGVVLVFRDSTEKKRAEDAVQRSQALYSSLVDQMPAGVFRKDAEGRYVFVNSLFCELKGITPEQFIGKTAMELEITDKVLAAAGSSHHEQIMQTGQTIAAEETHIRSDGKRLYFQAVKTPVFDSDGKITGSQGVLFDVTPQKEAEAAAAESQLLYHSLVNQMPAGIFRKDAAGRYVFVNPYFCALRNATPEVFLGKLPTELTEAEDRFKTEAANHHAQIMQTGCTIKVLDEYHRVDGETLFFQVTKTPVYNSEGAIIGSQGILFDVTQNKRTEEQLSEIIKHTRCIVNSGEVSGPPGWEQHALDAETPFSWKFPVLNPGAAQTVLPLELSPNELYERVWTRSRHPADHIQMNKNSGQALLTGAAFYRNEFRCTDKNGNLHWMQQHVSVEKISKNCWHIFGITTDVTELKSSQELYQALFDASPAGFLRLDKTGAIIDANDTICQLTGYTPADLIGHPVKLFAAPRDAGLVAAHLQKILAGGVHVHEVENLTKDGQLLFVKIVESCIQFPDGHKEILCNVINITERKQAEFLLEKQKEILELVATGGSQEEVLTALCRLVDSQSSGLLASILLLDPDGIHLRHGAAPNLPAAYCQAIDGVEIGSVVGSCGTAAFLKKQVVVEDIATDRLWQKFSSLAAEHSLRACWSTPIFDAQKNVLGTFAIYSRLPGRPTAEQQRLVEVATHIAALIITKKKEEAQLVQLAAIVESSDDAIISKTLEGIITSWNQGAEKVFGYSANEVIGQPLLILFPPERQHEEPEILAKVSRGENVSHFETVRVRKDGQRIDISATISPLKDVTGKIIGASKVARDITERKGAAVTIAVERARFKLIFDSLPIGIAFHTFHPDGTFARDINEAHLKICGITREQHNDPTIYGRISHPDDYARQKVFTAQVAAGTIKQFSLEKRYLHADGKVVWVNFSYQREIFSDGTIEELTTVVEITERKAAEAALQLSEFSVNQASLPTLWIARDARIVRTNHAACALLGYTEAELLQLAITDLDPDFPVERWPVHWQELRERKHMCFETRQRHKDGHIVPIEVDLSWFEFGGKEYNFAFIRDITERKREAENKVRSFALLRATLDSTADGILTVGSDNQIISFNEMFMQMWRIPAGVLAANDDKLALEHVLDQLKSPENFLAKVRHLYDCPLEESFDVLEFKDGRVFERCSRPMLVEGNPIGRVWSFRNITERKRLEEQLRQSQKMEAIGQLSGGIAHDFNNILTAILGNATLLSDPEIDSTEAQECLQEIIRAARRAADLTRQLLLFSRKQTMQPATVDLNQVVSRSAKMLQRILGEDIALHTDFTHGLPPVSADSGMVEQAILNLAVNARDAMPGGGQLQLTTRLENVRSPEAAEISEPRPHLCLVITDTGSGIAPEVLPRIFEPFFTTKEVGKGTGLGLATVYGIVKQHNGWLTVSSEPGKGSTFKIYLPALAGHLPPPPTPSAITQLPRGTGIILVAEDEAPVRSFVS